ncbi:MAG TPA: hypothetical protein VES19_00585 [Candidatus Limnocylindrales bacterium]|nr:hypothetical protein [Candidatus Limnocylindrales bacterium]
MLVAIPARSAIAGVFGMFFVVPAIGVVAVTWRSVILLMGARATATAAPSGVPPGPEDVAGQR